VFLRKKRKLPLRMPMPLKKKLRPKKNLQNKHFCIEPV
jgi:hypothetical protein